MGEMEPETANDVHCELYYFAKVAHFFQLRHKIKEKEFLCCDLRKIGCGRNTISTSRTAHKKEVRLDFLNLNYYSSCMFCA